MLIILFIILFIGCDNQSKDFKYKDIEPINKNAETLIYNNQDREYLLYVPTSYDTTTKYPLLFNFHGFGGNASEYMENTNMTDIAETEQIILVYPQGSLLEGIPHWNAALDTPDNKSDIDDLGFIDSLINHLSTNFTIDSTRIYACGFSNGAMFSYALACYTSYKIAAISSMSGAMLDLSSTCNPSHPIPLLKFHGTSDNVLPYDGNSYYSSVNEIIEFWTTQNNITDIPIIENFSNNDLSIEKYTYNNNNLEQILLYKIIDGNHEWFDLENDGLNTSEIIWTFLNQHYIDDPNSQK